MFVLRQSRAKPHIEPVISARAYHQVATSLRSATTRASDRGYQRKHVAREIATLEDCAEFIERSGSDLRAVYAWFENRNETFGRTRLSRSSFSQPT